MSNDTRWGDFRLSEAQVRREIRRTTRRDGRMRVRQGLLILCCTAACFGMLMKWALLGVVVLRGDGMFPALRGGDVVLYAHSLPVSGAATLRARAGELVLVVSHDGKARRRVVRRVIALGGDEVSVDIEGRVTVNGEALDEPYATYRIGAQEESVGESLIPNPFALDREEEEPKHKEFDPRWEEIEFPVKVPEGKVFVLADDRDAFDDSRSSAFGMINESDVLGLPCAVLWPVDRIRRLESFRAQEHLSELNPVAGRLSTPAPTEAPSDGEQTSVLQ